MGTAAAVRQGRGAPGGPGLDGLVQQLGQRGPVAGPEKPCRPTRARGIGQRRDPAVHEAVDRGTDGDRMALQQIGNLGRGPAAIEEADALGPLPGRAGQIAAGQQCVQVTVLIVSQLDTEAPRHASLSRNAYPTKPISPDPLSWLHAGRSHGLDRCRRTRSGCPGRCRSPSSARPQRGAAGSSGSRPRVRRAAS